MQDIKEETIVGYIDKYIYTSEDSNYKVAHLILKDKSEVSITGSFPMLNEGLEYEFTGSYKEHLKYGRQFIVKSYQRSEKMDKQGIISYLSSDKFHGIGKKIAEKIVAYLGEDCINKILENKDILDGIVNSSKKDIIYDTLKENLDIERIYIKLYSFGLTTKMVEKLFNIYSTNVVDKIEQNPYILIDEVEGFGFKKCDALALSMGIKPDDMLRLSSALKYSLDMICNNEGFTYLTKAQLINSALNFLSDESITEDKLNDALEYLLSKNKVIMKDDKIYPLYLYNSEIDIKNKILKMKSNKSLFDSKKIEELINEIEKDFNLQYEELQRKAIINSLTNKLSIITGGPGTGKSTILRGILECYARLNDTNLASEKMDLKVALASPTGRAAKRMAETSGFPAKTIHRLLGYNYEGTFTYDDSNLLPFSLIIIDEASMLDVVLANSLFKALNNNTQLILIGDFNQLPSVGPGNVLHDLISSGIFVTTKLLKTVRQKEDSDIVKLSNMVLNEKIDFSIFNKKKEVFFYPKMAQDGIPFILTLIDNFIKKGGNLDKDIEVLIPMYLGVAGINECNRLIQEKFNPEKEKILQRDKIFLKKGDKVLLKRNNPDLDLMNGDIGKVIDIVNVDDKDKLYLDFDNKIIDYPIDEIQDLTLAYAISIHKSQGSEFDNVIVPIFKSYSIMLTKNLIYTAITRAKKKLIIIGDPKTLSYAITILSNERQTSLLEFLSNNKNDNRIRINDPEIPFEFDGEYDMEGITPYSFMD